MSDVPVLLVVDDERAILHAFRRAFKETEYHVITAESAAEGIDCFATAKPDVVILDIQLPDMSGLDAFLRLREIRAKTPVIFVTGHGTTDTAIVATKRGAFDYLVKPLELSDLRRVVNSAVRVSRLQTPPAIVHTDDASNSDVIVGNSAVMNDVYKSIGRVASQDVMVLVTGESGTGKELVARAICHHSERAEEPFLAINCAAIPEAILESELFGHEKGAFTGADQMRIGKCEQCNGGTLFLDEVGDMAPTTQIKILRLLEEQRFEGVGGNDTIETDVRLIAATNCNLEELVDKGQFRQDLFFRLSMFTIHLPPLREREGDLDLLTRHFVKRFAAELHKDVRDVSPDAAALLARYPWPGNVRELQSAIKQALLRATGYVLIPEFLPSHIRDWQAVELSDGQYDVTRWDNFITEKLSEGSENVYAESTALTDRHLLMRVLRHTGGNQLQAARILGISRATLRNRLRAVGINVDEIDW